MRISYSNSTYYVVIVDILIVGCYIKVDRPYIIVIHPLQFGCHADQKDILGMSVTIVMNHKLVRYYDVLLYTYI